MRHTTVLAMLALVPLTGAACGPRGPASAPTSRPSITRPAAVAEDHPASRAARATLREIRPKVEFAKVRLDSVLGFFRDVTGLNLVVNWDALQASGIDRSTTLTLTLSNVSNERALTEALAAVGGVVPLAYILDEGVIRVSTREDLSTIITIRVYDVADLVATDIDLSSQEKAEALGDVIRAAISRHSWAETGGITGSLAEFDGLFVVSQTPETHTRLAELLTTIRRKLDERTAPPPDAASAVGTP